ncbi:hypothetical protein Stube_41850 [Streptomyces tubercidicus]|uniref:Uncharacterized protein n=1 Tax=Streptomyces tubercidicus TaxID=47759 RepID=A0A640UVW2_9ACTN|nr:hypothetical protein Stube_41850 [Streptomyces tubercidicus]
MGKGAPAGLTGVPVRARRLSAAATAAGRLRRGGAVRVGPRPPDPGPRPAESLRPPALLRPPEPLRPDDPGPLPAGPRGRRSAGARRGRGTAGSLAGVAAEGVRGASSAAVLPGAVGRVVSVAAAPAGRAVCPVAALGDVLWWVLRPLPVVWSVPVMLVIAPVVPGP